jgi:hypothetical protein
MENLEIYMRGLKPSHLILGFVATSVNDYEKKKKTRNLLVLGENCGFENNGTPYRYEHVFARCRETRRKLLLFMASDIKNFMRVSPP